MRFLILISLTLAALATSAGEPAQPYPLWDGHETIAEYAKRANLPATKTLDLGNGVKLELVLIPAGRFMMGTSEPEKVDESSFRTQICVGVVVTSLGVGFLFVMLGFALARTRHKKLWPQTSLAGLMVFVLVASIVLWSGIHLYFSVRALADARSEYEAASSRFKSSDDDEKPAHEVTLTKPYYVGKYEVTQEQYQQVMGNNPCAFRGQSNLPVESVTWDNAWEFCDRVKKMVAQPLRLPYESEWEYACRAGTRTVCYSGDRDADLERVAWYRGNSGGRTHPVGEKEPNAFGLYDVHGNVWEWCEDDTHENYEGAPSDGSAWICTPRGDSRVWRGGSWENDAWWCRSACRRGNLSYNRYSHVGFRVALSAWVGGVEDYRPAPPSEPKSPTRPQPLTPDP